MKHDRKCLKGVGLLGHNDNYYFLHNRYKGTLEIMDLRVEDRGTYNCRLKNVAGEVEGSTELLIITKPVVEVFNNVT